jgi:hypothetical protein
MQKMTAILVLALLVLQATSAAPWLGRVSNGGIFILVNGVTRRLIPRM